ncbi:predicted protein [Arabidopsis lyrata subsp. lyrata]|uniref:Predicted protein n=1 Tax=Arabidopsis lyrata subsp. lyrata TaxID=81972 RepID=D7LPL1_ARALL|nr:predicted protein [Arabidopsis lyrata subsp. lyrata]
MANSRCQNLRSSVGALRRFLTQADICALEKIFVERGRFYRQSFWTKVVLMITERGLERDSVHVLDGGELHLSLDVFKRPSLTTTSSSPQWLHKHGNGKIDELERHIESLIWETVKERERECVGLDDYEKSSLKRDRSRLHRYVYRDETVK